MATCLLVRHGHSTANADGVLSGWMPGVDLTETGAAQVRALAERLRDVPVVAVVSSPLQRCRRTAELLGLGEPTLDDRLGECGYGAWTGRSLKDLAAEPLWRVVQDEPATAVFPPSETYAAESLAQMTARVVGALEELDARIEAEHGPQAVWVAVSHGDPIKAALASVVAGGTDAGVAALQRVHVDPASVSIVARARGRATLLASNRTGEGVAQLVRPRDDTPPGDAAVGGGAG